MTKTLLPVIAIVTGSLAALAGEPRTGVDGEIVPHGERSPAVGETAAALPPTIRRERPEGTYTLAAVRRASDTPALAPVDAAPPAPGRLQFGDRLTWHDGRTCDAWRLEDTGDASPAVADPNLSDLQTGRPGEATEDRRLNRFKVVVCNGETFGSFIAIDERVLVTRSPDGTWFYVYEAPLDAARVQAVQRALAARGLYTGPVDGTLSAATRRGIARFADQRGAAYAFQASALTENLLGALSEPPVAAVGALTRALPELEMKALPPRSATDEIPDPLRQGLRGATLHRYRSTRPISDDEGGKTYLRYRLKVLEYASPESAAAAAHALLASADPDTGLSYAWDHIEWHGRQLYWLDAPCLLSAVNWQRLLTAMGRALPAGQGKAFACRCGHGCRLTEPARTGRSSRPHRAPWARGLFCRVGRPGGCPGIRTALRL